MTDIIDAGLGRLGRNGLLLTKEYGACVRLGKILTDLPLAPDERPEETLSSTCRSCLLCADACEAEAIHRGGEPTAEPACRSNNPGILRWLVYHDRCYSFWVRNGNDCSTCIAACPLTPKPTGRPPAL